MAFIQVRVEEELKDEVVKIFGHLGLDLSTAVRLFLKRCVEEKDLPFNLKNEKISDKPNSIFEIRTKILAPQKTSPYDILDEIMTMCNNKNWVCNGGGVKFQSNYITISSFITGKMYFSSDKKLEYLNSGDIVTPCKELAIISKLHSTFITISEPTIFYDGENREMYLYEIDEPIDEGIDYIQYNQSKYSQGYEYILKRKVKIKCLEHSDILNEKI